MIVSAGLIVFRRVVDSVEYLVLKHSNTEGHWSPPKGKIDPGEALFDAALRETREETGLTVPPLVLHKDFHNTVHYQRKGVPKKIDFWLAELCDDTDVKLSEEHTEFKWLKVTEASEYVRYKEVGGVIKEADVFIQKNILKL
ncbi:bis(5'-nucleosyl)-tetraphosphatase [asymmetrical]-like [Mya arenaria]|uniref:bis(5'-nucleosyl)-tetraphosphatase [asymmetrical]-like n=1 Tax=Mya arenaria TaxID=6604 RepID=UPI0022E56AFD|nr:bis(5'-nucleosyl)-tetraphosphatase [asymmetrical]-like [Mya arenaria]